MGEHHLEAPVRVEIIEQALRDSKLSINFKEARPATVEEILSVHSPYLYDAVFDSSGQEQTVFTLDTIANAFTYDSAMTAAGGALEIAENIGSKKLQFGMLRPPGHHSTYDAAMGFCFFNNIALAAQKLLDKKYKRIAIIDIDHHHGNGTQELFYGQHEVLYTSLHADPHVAFPGTGFIEETGFGEGIGKTVNIPLPVKTSDADYLTGFDEVIFPIVNQYKPDAILVSLGLDGLNDDPYGVLGLSTTLFYEAGKRIAQLAQKHCKNKIGVILEGGYKYDEIGIATEKFFQGLENPNGESYIIPDLTYRFEQVLRTVKATQRSHWFDI